MIIKITAKTGPMKIKIIRAGETDIRGEEEETEEEEVDTKIDKEIFTMWKKLSNMNKSRMTTTTVNTTILTRPSNNLQCQPRSKISKEISNKLGNRKLKRAQLGYHK